MPRRVTMATLRTRCQRRCDKENDSSISSAEWNALISESFGELWGVVAESGMRYWEASENITATGAAGYDEPDDMLALISVDHLEQGTTTGRRRSLEPLMVQERYLYAGQTGTARKYEVSDDQLRLYPNPSSGTYQWVYIPQPTDLADYADGDVVDVVTADGERFIVWCTAVKALAKSESDVSLAIVERDQAREALREWAVLRAFNDPRRQIIRDIGEWTDPADWINR